MTAPERLTLVRCATLDVYRAITERISACADRRLAPVLDGPDLSLAGFPADTRVLAANELEPCADAVPAPTVVPGRLCISLGDPVCHAIGRLLQHAVGKQWLPCDDIAGIEALLRARIATQEMTSVLFVVPLWAHDRLSSRPSGPELSPRQFGAVVELMRTLWPGGGEPSWGVLAAPSPTALSLLAARTILQAPLSARYRGAPVGLSTPTSEPEVAVSAALRLLPRRRRGEPPGDLPARWSLLVFQGHGRPYCASFGQLCAASGLPRAAETEDCCVLGMRCADASYPRTDPRSHDAPVLVLDTCGAGNWEGPLWTAGTPPLAFLAITGPATAIVTSDGLTFQAAMDSLEIFHALLASDTLGAATRRFCASRQEGNPPLPYFLLGDPDLPAGPSRWPGLLSILRVEHVATTAERTVWTATTGPATRFCCIPLPLEARAAAPAAVFVETAAPDDIAACRLFPADGTRPAELWLELKATATPLAFRLSVEPPMRCPVPVVDAAGAIHTQSALLPPFDGCAAPVVVAARRLAEVDRSLAAVAGTAVVGPPSIAAEAVVGAMLDWTEAHVDAVGQMLEHATAGLWPFEIHDVRAVEVSRVHEPCPLCGSAPLQQRTYRTGPEGLRRWLECRCCEIVLDGPLRPTAPRLRLHAPGRLGRGDTIVARLTLDNTASPGPCCGAAALLVTGRQRYAVIEPRIQSVTVAAGTCAELALSLHLEASAVVAHRFYLRALALLDGAVHWASSPLLLGVDA